MLLDIYIQRSETIRSIVEEAMARVDYGNQRRGQVAKPLRFSSSKHTRWSLMMIFSAFAIFAGCASNRAYYDVGLREVERPAEAKERYGEQLVSTIDEDGTTKYSFEDALVKVVWIPTVSQFLFVLTNKTDHSMRIVWDEAAFVDENGLSQRVTHSGVRYIDRNSHQPPTVVVREGTVADSIIPSDNIYYQSGRYGGWRERPLFPVSTMSADELNERVGNTVQILLPLQIQDIINEYLFVFVVQDVIVK